MRKQNPMNLPRSPRFLRTAPPRRSSFRIRRAEKLPPPGESRLLTCSRRDFRLSIKSPPAAAA